MSNSIADNSKLSLKKEKDPCRDECRRVTPIGKWPWPAQFLLALVVIIAILALLVGLPAASMLVTKNITGSLGGAVSFWGASFAAFISLSVVIISGVFVITAFKVESSAKYEAHNAAIEGIKEAKEKMEKELKAVEKELEEAKEKAKKELEKLVEKQALDMIKEKADNYVKNNGREITKKAADEHIVEIGAEIIEIMKDAAEKAADTYIGSDGAKITGERIDSHLREEIEGTGLTRLEKVMGELVAKTSAEAVDRMVDERLSSLGFRQRLDVLLKRPLRHDGPGTPGNGKR